jgi:hypothetical protein
MRGAPLALRTRGLSTNPGTSPSRQFKRQLPIFAVSRFQAVRFREILYFHKNAVNLGAYERSLLTWQTH